MQKMFILTKTPQVKEQKVCGKAGQETPVPGGLSGTGKKQGLRHEAARYMKLKKHMKKRTCQYLFVTQGSKKIPFSSHLGKRPLPTISY